MPPCTPPNTTCPFARLVCHCLGKNEKVHLKFFLLPAWDTMEAARGSIVGPASPGSGLPEDLQRHCLQCPRKQGSGKLAGTIRTKCRDV